MEDKPGTPPEGEKPKQNPKKISFTLDELILDQVFSVEGSSFMTFICSDKYILSMKRWEYFELLNAIYDLMEMEDDVTVTISPDYEVIDEKVPFVSIIINTETKEQTETRTTVPHYTVFNLLKNLSPNIEERNINLN